MCYAICKYMPTRDCCILHYPWFTASAHYIVTPGPHSVKPSGYQLKHPQILLPNFSVYLRVLNGLSSGRLYRYAALTDCFCITETECVYCAVRTESLNVNQVQLGQQTVKSGRKIRCSFASQMCKETLSIYEQNLCLHLRTEKLRSRCAIFSLYLGG